MAARVRRRGRFAGRDRSVPFSAAGGLATEEARRELACCLKLGLPNTPSRRGGRQLDVTFKKLDTDKPVPVQQRTLNYWVLRVGMDSYGNGEQSNVSRSFYFNGKRESHHGEWKIRTGVSRSLNKNTFDLEDARPSSRVCLTGASIHSSSRASPGISRSE